MIKDGKVVKGWSPKMETAWKHISRTKLNRLMAIIVSPAKQLAGVGICGQYCLIEDVWASKPAQSRAKGGM